MSVDWKSLLKSKTFWSDVCTIVVGGLQISDTYAHTHILNTPIASTSIGILGLLGIYGRVTANTQILTNKETVK